MSDQSHPMMMCEQCAGTGHTPSGARCVACGGKGFGVWTHNRFLWWGRSLDTYHIRYRAVARVWNTWVNVLLFLVGGASIVWFVWVTCSGIFLLNGAAAGTTFFTSAATNIFLGVGILAVLLAVSRTIRTKPAHSEVAPHAYLDDASGKESQPISWVSVRSLPRTVVQDIATCMTPELLVALEASVGIARRVRATSVTPRHLLHALFSDKRIQGLGIRLLFAPDQVQKLVEALFEPPHEGVVAEPMISHELWAVLFAAYEEAWNAREPLLDTTDALAAIFAGDERVRDMFFDMAVKPDMVRNSIMWVRVRERMRRARAARVRGSQGRARTGDTNRAMTALATPFLNSFSTDLTKASLFGTLEPMIGREREIESIFRVLQGGGMSVMLVGNSGVGKESIVGGIAELMVAENVPEILRDKRLVELDVARLLAGASPSDAQDRLLSMLYELERAGNIVLVIPSIEKMIGITVGGAQSLDVAGVLATELGKGNFLTIATTTPEAFNRVIANQSIGSVFQKVSVEEMDANAAIQVLEAKAPYIEYKHTVWFSYEALDRSVLLAQRYLHDSYMPENAIELINEAALYVRNKRGKDQLVRAEDVSAIVAEKSHIPVTAVTEDESEKLMRLEAEMHRRVIGQDEAVTLVANALRRARAEIRSGKRPIANLLFLGPTGVGKTELTKTIAEVYFGSETQMIRLDMSEYQDTNSLYRMIGRPGEQGTGSLTEAVRQKPFSLILLDELEKAEPNILNVFLQVMDDGRLTDSVGRVIDFTNVILIATSNAGTSFVQDQMRAGATSDHIKNQLIHGELKQYFRPEFLNRFDAIVLFQPLTKPQIEQIARLIIIGMGKKLEDRGIFLEITDAAVASLASAGYDPEFGARPLRRVIQDKVENAIAGLLLQNLVKRKDTIVVDVDGVHVRGA